MKDDYLFWFRSGRSRSDPASGSCRVPRALSRPSRLHTAARLSPNPNDYALIALLGLLGLRIFEACGANIGDLGEEHGHRVLGSGRYPSVSPV